MSFFYEIYRDGMEFCLDIEITYAGSTDIEWQIGSWSGPDAEWKSSNPPDLTDDETEAIDECAWEFVREI